MTERCLGTGFFARDPAGNPNASCPVCGAWSRLTKRGTIRAHNCAVQKPRTNFDRLHEIDKEIQELERQLRTLKTEKNSLFKRPNLRDTEGKRYIRQSRNARVVYTFDRIRIDNSYRPHYDFDVVTVRLKREDGKGAIWITDAEFRYDFVEI